MPSSPQTVPTIAIYDYLYDDAGAAVVGAKVYAQLQYNLSVNVSPQTLISPVKYSAETDTNGYFTLSLVPNPNLSPSGTTYLVTTPFNSYEIIIPASGGPYQSSSLIVNAPTIITPSTSTVGALTTTGLLTAGAGLSVVGAVTLPAASIPESTVVSLTSDLAARAQLASANSFSGTNTFTQPINETGSTSPFTVQGRFCGTMSTVGAPGSGTWQAGDFGFDANYNMWICTAGGTPGTWVPGNGNSRLQSNTITASTTSTFSSIPQYARHLQIKVNAVGPGGGPTSTDVSIQVNSDVSSHYWWSQLYITGTTVAGAANGAAGTSATLLQLAGSSANSSYGIIDIPFYTSTGIEKGFLGNSFHIEGFSSASNAGVMRWGWWQLTSAITTIELIFSNAVTGTADLYGIL